MKILPDPRPRLQELAAARRCTLPELSRMIGRPERYLTGFARHGEPERLDPRDCRVLARFFDVAEADLGGDDPRWAKWRDHAGRVSDRKLGRAA